MTVYVLRIFCSRLLNMGTCISRCAISAMEEEDPFQNVHIDEIIREYMCAPLAMYNNTSDGIATSHHIVPSLHGVLMREVRGSAEVAKLLGLINIQRDCFTLSPAIMQHIDDLCAALTRPDALLLPICSFSAASTVTTRAITNIVMTRTSMLHHGCFDGASEGFSKLLVGSRGTGKTCALKRCAILAELLYSDIRSVYIDARYPTAADHPFSKYHGLINTLLRLFTVEADNPEFYKQLCTPGYRGTITDIQEHLPKQQRFVIIIDEMEDLYRDDSALHRVVVEDIEMLAKATFAYGKILLILCGCAAFSHKLLQSTISSSMRSFYKLAFRDMNGQKLPELRLPRELPTALDVCVSFHPKLAAETNSVRKLHIQRVFVARFGSSAYTLHRCAQQWRLPADALHSTEEIAFAVAAYPLAVQLLDCLYVELVNANRGLLETLTGPPSVDANIASVAWESALQPLPISKAEKLFQRLASKPTASASADEKAARPAASLKLAAGGSLQHGVALAETGSGSLDVAKLDVLPWSSALYIQSELHLKLLSDCGAIVYEEDDFPANSKIYPSSLCTLLEFYKQNARK